MVYAVSAQFCCYRDDESECYQRYLQTASKQKVIRGEEVAATNSVLALFRKIGMKLLKGIALMDVCLFFLAQSLSSWMPGRRRRAHLEAVMLHD